MAAQMGYDRVMTTIQLTLTTGYIEVTFHPAKTELARIATQDQDQDVTVVDLTDNERCRLIVALGGIA